MKDHTCSPLKCDENSDCNTKCPACRIQDNIQCTCPDWWFPLDRRDVLKKIPHNFGKILQHHDSCAKRNHS